jgi:hypothetical protein
MRLGFMNGLILQFPSFVAIQITEMIKTLSPQEEFSLKQLNIL